MASKRGAIAGCPSITGEAPATRRFSAARLLWFDFTDFQVAVPDFVAVILQADVPLDDLAELFFAAPLAFGDALVPVVAADGVLADFFTIHPMFDMFTRLNDDAHRVSIRRWASARP